MKKETLSVLSACALGAFIGALSALEIQSYFEYGSYFWGIGALFGGTIAYIAVDFRQFCDGVVHLYRNTVAWRPHWLWWRALGLVYIETASFVSTAILIFILPFVILANLDSTFVALMILLWMGIIGWFSIGTVFLGFLGTARDGKSREEWECNLKSSIKRSLDGIHRINPVSVAILLTRCVISSSVHILHGLYDGAVHSPQMIAAIGSSIKTTSKTFVRFIASVFVRVHSNRRTLCFVDATLGAVSGFFLGSATLGAVVGAILGVINYELISRWLKLVPIKK